MSICPQAMSYLPAVERDRLRQAGDGVLGRRVGRGVRPRRVGRDRAVVDDAPAPRVLRLHQPERLLRAEERAGEVRRRRPLPLLEGQVLERHGRRARAGVVEEQVEPAERAFGLARRARCTEAGSPTSVGTTQGRCAGPRLLGSRARAARAGARRAPPRSLRSARPSATALPMPAPGAGDEGDLLRCHPALPRLADAHPPEGRGVPGAQASSSLSGATGGWRYFGSRSRSALRMRSMPSRAAGSTRRIAWPRAERRFVKRSRT